MGRKKSHENKKIELLAPAGSPEKMRIAFEFGADAVYFGLPDFSLRARINKFSKKEIEEAAVYCKKKNKKFYLTYNIYAHHHHIEKLSEQVEFIRKIEPDALIISDPGIFNIIKKELPNMEVHLSTQANVTNHEAAKFWQNQGAQRIILARENTLEEIKKIKQKVPGMELECFVHGAMCMAYSGRCVLSKWMAGRSANLGDCAQPCRWRYHNHGTHNSANSESSGSGAGTKHGTKEGGFIDDQERFELDIQEDQHGTYLFNSYDLMLIEHLEKLVVAGISSFKIEGRAKSVYYAAITTRAYRKVLEAIIENKNQKELGEIIKKQKEELQKLSNRGFWTGFLFDDEPPHLLDKASEEPEDMFVGISNEKIRSSRRRVFAHNHFKIGDQAEAITPEKNIPVKVKKIFLPGKGEVESAHGGMNRIYEVEFDKKVEGIFLLRKTVTN